MYAFDDIPKITIVTVVYNNQKFLESTIRSVLSQNYKNIEYIIIDGGSTDGTIDIIRKYENNLYYWISESDSGIYDAMNKAILKLSLNSWVLFLNSGDYFFDNDILMRVSHSFSDSLDFIFGDVAIRNKDSLKIVKARKPSETEMPGCHQSMLVRSELLQKHFFDLSYRVGADFEFYLRSNQNINRVGQFNGVISEISPEGFSALNENTLQRDYFRAIFRYRGKTRAFLWLIRRNARRIFLGLYLFSHLKDI